LDEDVFDSWLETARPDVVLITHPIMYKWLRNRHFQVPETIGVVQLFSDTIIPELAHVCRNYVSIGSTLVDLVIDQLQRNERGIPDAPKVVSVETTWDEGASLRA
jgi:LacI family transcriptional regulator